MGTTLKLFPLLIILFGIASRLLPHLPNFAPITAIALFGGVYLPKKYAFILPLVALFVSDLFLGFYGTTMYYVYGSFILSGLIGLWLRNHKNTATVLGGTLLASILFYLITNFGVWANTASWYTRDFQGLLNSYIAGIPFFRNTLFGDLFFTITFFLSYEIAFRLGVKFLPKKLARVVF